MPTRERRKKAQEQTDTERAIDAHTKKVETAVRDYDTAIAALLHECAAWMAILPADLQERVRQARRAREARDATRDAMRRFLDTLDAGGPR